MSSNYFQMLLFGLVNSKALPDMSQFLKNSPALLRWTFCFSFVAVVFLCYFKCFWLCCTCCCDLCSPYLVRLVSSKLLGNSLKYKRAKLWNQTKFMAGKSVDSHLQAVRVSQSPHNQSQPLRAQMLYEFIRGLLLLPSLKCSKFIFQAVHRREKHLGPA